ncbi:hypothetical protein C1645_839233 [Glomus cerebriforme]|uniref:Uncharacterized protein n=1 Tax=Glomus cerebriforme TaxID=658196 RepID=A0A397S604_9GLOM|nr:hypothetical protein C1645_839233 [Glomus cerebriforme]
MQGKMFSKLFGPEWKGKRFDSGNLGLKTFAPELEKLKHLALKIQDWKHSASEIWNRKRNFASET